MKVLIRILLNALAIWVVAALLDGFVISGGLTTYVLAGLVIGLLNAFLKPILTVLSFPLIIVTFGLFLLVINAIILWIVDRLFTSISIDTTGTLFLATILFSILNYFFSQAAD